MKLKDILKIEDANDFVVELNDHISEKCQYGDNMDALSVPERLFYVAQTLEMEVNNGGFSQFFYNSSGAFAGEVVQAFETIGARRTAQICGRALAVFGREIPVDHDERQEMLDEMDCDEVNDILEECDDAFYEYEDDLNALNRAYVLKNKAMFS